MVLQFELKTNQLEFIPYTPPVCGAKCCHSATNGMLLDVAEVGAIEELVVEVLARPFPHVARSDH